MNGAPKPLYFGLPVPLAVIKRGSGFSLWGLVRPATGATKVTVLVQLKGAKHYKQAEDRHDQQRWATGRFTPPRAGVALARALDEPHAASSTKDRRSPPPTVLDRPLTVGVSGWTGAQAPAGPSRERPRRA